MKEILEDIKNKNFKNIYLFYGEENYLKNYYEDKLKKSIIDEVFSMMNIDEFDGKNVNVQSIIDSANTSPFLSERRLILVKSSGLFITGKKYETDKFTDFICNIPSTTIILFIEQSVDKRNKLYKALNRVGSTIEFKIPKETEIINWVMGLFSKNNMFISKACATKFIQTVPYNMETMVLEINKLVNYKGENNEITEKDIEFICTKSLDTKIFELVKAVGERNLEKSLDIYSNLLIMKEQPLMILAMVTRQFRLILRCKALSSKGASVNEIATTLELRSFVVTECIKQGKNFKYDTLLKALNECLEMDINIKNGKLNDKLAVEIFIIKYTNSN